MNQFLATAGIIALVVALYALFWCVVMTIIAHVTGWAALARRYALVGRFEGRR